MQRVWKKGEVVQEYSCPYLSVVKTTFENDIGYKDDFYSITFTDWVHIVPETKDGDLIFVELFRFGAEVPSLELPGGQVTQGRSPEETAAAELLEETGYEGRLESLGWVHPNPAVQANKCFLYVARDVELKAAQKLEPAEDISLHTISRNDVGDVLNSGKIIHSLSVLGILKYMQTCEKSV